MGRPARHDSDSLLDSARTLAAAAGPSAVTMTAVASLSGAPSGSVYHRFPTRSALLGALWLRTLERFHAGLLDAVATGDPVTAAQHSVSWSRDHPSEARVLLNGAAGFAQTEWPAETQQRVDAAQQRVTAALTHLAQDLGLRGRAGRERLVFALTDIPLALVRRHLTAAQPIPAAADELIAATTRALLPAATNDSRGQGKEST
jgi:AcrR family transcriptional regulator